MSKIMSKQELKDFKEKEIVPENWDYNKNCRFCGNPCYKVDNTNKIGERKIFCDICYFEDNILQTRGHKRKHNPNFSEKDFCDLCKINYEKKQHYKDNQRRENAILMR